jgi:plastocyanin
MTLPDVFDDLWKRGLAQLAPDTEFFGDAGERVQARVSRRQTRRKVTQTIAIAAVVVVTTLTIVASVRGDNGSEPPAGEPHVATQTPAPQHVDVKILEQNNLWSIAPSADYVTPGPVDIRFKDAVWSADSGIIPMVQLADGLQLTLGQRQTIEVPPGGYVLKAVVNGRTVDEVTLLLGRAYRRPTRAPDATIDVTAQQTLTLQPDRLHVRAGVVRIRYHDAAPGGTHTLFIDGIVGMPGLEVSRSGEVKSIDVELTPGTYTLYCTIPGHRAAGMQATLVVTKH